MSEDRISLDEFLEPVNNAVEVRLPSRDKTILVKPLTRAQARRMDDFTKKNKDNQELVDAWILKETVIEPDLQELSMEKLVKMLDNQVIGDILHVVKEIVRISGIDENQVEDLKKE